MSPTVLQPSRLWADLVFSGSLWYSNCIDVLPGSNQTTPLSPVGSSLPSSSRMWTTAVFGVPNREMGEEVKAVVQPIDFAAAGPDLERELIEFCRDNLAHYKCPVSVDFEAELPRQPTGKLYKRLLRDRYWGNQKSRIV